MIRHFIPLLTALLALAVPAFVADAVEPFPGHELDRRTIEIQQKVDSLFEDGEYERAMIIYRNELAPLGDKYAQYMVGYMHLAGKGIEQDVSAAAAWFRLAAERRDEMFARASEQLHARLSDEDRTQANQLFVGLRRELGDAALILELVEEDIALLRRSRQDSTLVQRAVDRSAAGSSIQSFNGLESRIRARLDYVGTALRTDPFAIDAEVERLRELRRRAEDLIRGLRRSR